MTVTGGSRPMAEGHEGSATMVAPGMYDYWKSQPTVLAAIVERRASLFSEFVRLYRETDPDSLFLIGSGTSFNAEATAAPFMEEILGIQVTASPASRLPRIHGHRPLVVLLSQEGTSTNTLAALERVADLPHIALTGESGGELERRARQHMLIGCGPEKAGPKTVGYSASVMALYLSALEAGHACGVLSGPEHRDHIATLERAVADMSVNLPRVEAWLETQVDDLVTVRKYALVGKGVAGITAVEGALKILETVRMPALGYEFEEYLHGPILMTDPDLGGIFFITEDPLDKARMLTLADCHGELSGHTYRIISDPTVDGVGTLVLNATGRGYTEPFETVIVPQAIGARIPGLLDLPDGDVLFHFFADRLSTKQEGSGSPA